MVRSSRLAQDFLDQLQAAGRWSFSSEEALGAHGGRIAAARAVLRRLRAASLIATPHRGFHVILTPQFRNLGCLPPEYFVDDLMEYLDVDYHVGLASAAAYHGATHQAVQKFQIMVDHPRRPILCGRVRIEFIMQVNLEYVPLYEFEAPSGSIDVSSPEATAFALIGYPDRVGGLNAATTMIDELSASLTRRELTALVKVYPLPWAQRLGYLFDMLGHEVAARAVLRGLERAGAWRVVPLSPHLDIEGSELDRRWGVLVNDDPESDL